MTFDRDEIRAALVRIVPDLSPVLLDDWTARLASPDDDTRAFYMTFNSSPLASLRSVERHAGPVVDRVVLARIAGILAKHMPSVDPRGILERAVVIVLAAAGVGPRPPVRTVEAAQGAPAEAVVSEEIEEAEPIEPAMQAEAASGQEQPDQEIWPQLKSARKALNAFAAATAEEVAARGGAPREVERAVFREALNHAGDLLGQPSTVELQEAARRLTAQRKTPDADDEHLALHLLAAVAHLFPGGLPHIYDAHGGPRPKEVWRIIQELLLALRRGGHATRWPLAFRRAAEELRRARVIHAPQNPR